MRGLRVLLLDKGDIASGTTSWSTRLIHGGLRYLEYYEFYLVRESLSEREKLLRIAPHLVKPLPFVVPTYESSRRGPTLVGLGMYVYDALSPSKSMSRHEMLSREEVVERAPGLNTEGLVGAALYYDGQVENDGQVEYAEKLAVENAALRARGVDERRHPQPHHPRPREGGAQDRRPHLHRRGEADDLPEPLPPDGR
ncbi:FAD-dependent oxidoreductase [Rubrobacter marinus]|uniref:FAD-dependent oxidoreductase n=1 Tax=Rubrobacter marinus TaxID=2653852 RepID=UPI001A9EDF41|nr:FAD-dependent oxidoreductase [Rubrobacter marinus]